MAKARTRTRAKPHAAGGGSKDGRAEVLRAATRAFADHGYEGATTAAIARAAKVTQPLVHHHFRSKRGVWSAVLEQLFQDLATTMAQTLQALEGVPRKERLAGLLRSLVHFSGERPELARLIRTEGTAGGEAFDELYENWLKSWIEFFESEVAAGVNEGVLRPVDPRLAYFAIVGASIEAFAAPLAAERAFGLDVREPEEIRRYADLVVDLVFNGTLLHR